MSLPPTASTDALLKIPEGVCVLTHDALVVDSIISSVGDDRAGATAVFIGTTRNSFKGDRDRIIQLLTISSASAIQKVKS